MLVCVGSSIGSIASAADELDPFEEPDDTEIFAFDPELVTVATRVAQPPSKAPNIVSIVDADQIRERGYRTLGDALRDLPGAYVWTSQEGRHLLGMRGIVSADNNKVLLLLDGIPLYDGVYTHAWIDEYLPLHQIRQIELIQGPGSAIYGTNALAGVVNIVTYSGAELEGGRVRALVGTGERVDIGVTAGDRGTFLGFEADIMAYARAFDQEGLASDLNPRGRRNVRAADPKGGVAIGTTVRFGDLTARVHHFDYHQAFLTAEQNDALDVFAGDTDGFGIFNRGTVIDVAYDWSVTKNTRIMPRITSQRHDNPGLYAFWNGAPAEGGGVDTLAITMVETEKDTRWFGGSINVESHPHEDHVFVGGLGIDQTVVLKLEDVVFSNLDATGSPSDFRAESGDKLRNAYAFATHTWTAIPQLELTFGGRIDQRLPANSDDSPTEAMFRTRISPRFAAVLRPSDAVNAKVLYGRAFRHANAREALVRGEVGEDGLYPFSSGSRDIRAEQIDTIDAEVTFQATDDLRLRAASSFSLLAGEIDKVTPPNQYQNLESTLQVITAEAEVIGTVGPVTLRGSYALTESRYNDSGPYANRRQFEIPPHMFKGRLRLQANSTWSAVILGEAYAARPRTDWVGETGLGNGDAFGLLHGTITASGLGKAENIQVQATVRNILNTEFETAVYRDEIARLTGPDDNPSARYPNGIAGETRRLLVGVEVGF